VCLCVCVFVCVGEVSEMHAHALSNFDML